MSRHAERDHHKEQFWRQQVRHWRRSGLTIRAFCLKHALSEPSFYAWRRTLAERSQQARRRRQEQGHGTITNSPPAFVPVQVVAAPPAAPLEIVLGPGRVVRVPTGFDAAALRQLLAVLEERPC